jgi:hypothetical protein
VSPSINGIGDHAQLAKSAARSRWRSRWAPNGVGKTIHAHPTLGESISVAAEAYEGVCTDLPAVRKR